MVVATDLDMQLSPCSVILKPDIDAIGERELLRELIGDTDSNMDSHCLGIPTNLFDESILNQTESP